MPYPEPEDEEDECYPCDECGGLGETEDGDICDECLGEGVVDY